MNGKKQIYFIHCKTINCNCYSIKYFKCLKNSINKISLNLNILNVSLFNETDCSLEQQTFEEKEFFFKANISSYLFALHSKMMRIKFAFYNSNFSFFSRSCNFPFEMHAFNTIFILLIDNLNLFNNIKLN